MRRISFGRGKRRVRDFYAAKASDGPGERRHWLPLRGMDEERSMAEFKGWSKS